MSNDTPKDRLKETIKSPYDAEGDVWNSLLEAFAQEFENYENTIDEVTKNKFVDTADAGSLERLADVFDIQRRTNEPVDQFRARLKTALRSQITSATVPEIREVTSVILDQPLEDIEIIEPYEFSPAFIELKVDLEGFDGGALIDIVELITAAGVDVGIRVVIDVGDSLGIRDATELSFPDLENPLSLSDATLTEFEQQSEPVVPTDAANNRVDDPDQSHWNEGIWNIDHYDTALVRFDVTPDQQVRLVDEATADFPVFTPDLILADSATSEFPDPEETFTVKQDENLMFDPDQQAHWNEGTWNIDHYDTAVFEFTLDLTDDIAIGDDVTFPPAVDPTTPYAVSDLLELPPHTTSTDGQAATDAVTDISSEEVVSAVWNHSSYTQTKGTTVWGERSPADSIPKFYAPTQLQYLRDVVETPSPVSPVTPYVILDETTTAFPDPTDGFALGDDAVTSDIEPEDSFTPTHDENVMFDVEQQSHWNVGTWNIDHYDTAIEDILLEIVGGSLAIGDSVTFPSAVTAGDSASVTDDVAFPSPVEATEGSSAEDTTTTEFEPVRSAVWTHSSWSVPKGTSVWGVQSEPKSIPHTRTSSSFAASDSTQLGFTQVSDATWNDATYDSSVTVWA